MAAAQEPAGSAASAAGRLYPVDVKNEKPEVLEAAAREYYDKILEHPSSVAEFLSVSGKEKVKVETSLLRFLPLYRQDNRQMLLVLNDPQRKNTGSLCDGHSSQCYLLPVLDTVFVRKKFRRCGLATKMLHDFCQTFPTEEALGISCPVSADMYRVCQRFLDTYPEERTRLWEVEAPGDWSQRISIWLKIQLAQNLPKKGDQSCHAEKFQDNEPGQSEDSWMKKRTVQVSNIQVSPDQAEEFKDDSEKPLGSQPWAEERVSQQEGQVHQRKKPKRRRGDPSDNRIPKQLRVVPHDGGNCF